MGAKTSIAWTQASWNPVWGCTPADPVRCANCYARTVHDLWFKKRGAFHDPRPVPDQLGVPLGWRKPRTIFVPSMGDLFHPAIADEYRAAVFGVMAACPDHRFLVLTGRAGAAAEWFRWIEAAETHPGKGALLPPEDKCQSIAKSRWVSFSQTWPKWGVGWPLPNAWIGASASTRAELDRQLPALRQIPAAHRFLSLEPLLEDLGELDLTGIDCVIVGGESGSGARPCAIQWIRRVLEQCRKAGVRCYVKQLGSRPVGEWGDTPPQYHLIDITVSPPKESVELSRTKSGVWKLRHRSGADPTEWPEDLRVRELAWRKL